MDTDGRCTARKVICLMSGAQNGSRAKALATGKRSVAEIYFFCRHAVTSLMGTLSEGLKIGRPGKVVGADETWFTKKKRNGPNCNGFWTCGASSSGRWTQTGNWQSCPESHSGQNSCNDIHFCRACGPLMVEKSSIGWTLRLTMAVET
eukprot:4222736-Amphidinium_carterae.2